MDMMNRIRLLWKQNKLLLAAFLVAAVATVFFAVRTVVFTLYWNNPDHRQQALEAWMTPQYVAYSYGLERDDVVRALGMEPGAGLRFGMGDIAAQQNVTLQDLQARISALPHD
jgi:hypothetical protein